MRNSIRPKQVIAMAANRTARSNDQRRIRLKNCCFKFTDRDALFPYHLTELRAGAFRYRLNLADEY
jgi:hypothetical protein